MHISKENGSVNLHGNSNYRLVQAPFDYIINKLDSNNSLQ